MKKPPNDWITKVCYLLIILSIVYIGYYFFLEKVNTCTEDPLKFAVNKIKSTTNAELISGSLLIIYEEGVASNERYHFGDEILALTNSSVYNFTE